MTTTFKRESTDVTPCTIEVDAEDLRKGYKSMVIGRRLDGQATNLAKQGYLTVYPSSLGQEACQVAAALALGESDWLFPTYRDTVAMITRGVDPIEALTLLRGDWHCGFDPRKEKVAPHSTPLATHANHAVGLALAARYKGEDTVSVVLCGEGATSEGDFHEAVNLAAVYDAPVVFFVQNNGYAISVPAHKQFKPSSVADKALGYGVRGVSVDGNDYGQTYRAVRTGIEVARQGGGPTLIEAKTYRLAPHTNADDPSLYRDELEVAKWHERDPIIRLKTFLEASGVLSEGMHDEVECEAKELALILREGVMRRPKLDAARLFSHVYSSLPPHVKNQREYILKGLDPK